MLTGCRENRLLRRPRPGISVRQNAQGGDARFKAVNAGDQQHMLSGVGVQSIFIGSTGEVHLSSGVAVEAFRVSAFGSEVIP